MRNKIPTKVLEGWISKLLEEFDADELFKMLANECDKKQTAYLHDAIKDELRLHDTYVIECTNLNDKLKFEAFMDDYKPFYNEQSLIFMCNDGAAHTRRAILRQLLKYILNFAETIFEDFITIRVLHRIQRWGSFFW